MALYVLGEAIAPSAADKTTNALGCACLIRRRTAALVDPITSEPDCGSSRKPCRRRRCKPPPRRTSSPSTRQAQPARPFHLPRSWRNLPHLPCPVHVGTCPAGPT